MNRSHQVFGVNFNADQLLLPMIELTLITTRSKKHIGGTLDNTTEELHQDDFEVASKLQHVGGNTNLIDFTKCYLVALFFACDGAPRKPGRVILLKQTEQIRDKYQIKKPRCPKHRITAQKSVIRSTSKRGY